MKDKSLSLSLLLAVPALTALPARADVVPPQMAAALSARDAEDEKKRQTCTPASDEDVGRYGRVITRRQVEYDIKPGEVTADTAELRRAVTSWLSERTAALRSCMPAQALMQVPERLTATVHLLIRRQTIHSVVVLGPGPQPPRASMDAACVQKVLLLLPELGPQAPSPSTARASAVLSYAPFCVITHERETPLPSRFSIYGRDKNRFLMPEAPPAPKPVEGKK